MKATPSTTTDSALEEMLRLQVIERGITNEAVLDAMRRVPRDRFFPAGTRDNVYADRAHPIGHGQTISQPYMVALMTERLSLRPTDRVLEVGTGSGYQTAILSRIVAEVFTVERIKPLLDTAFERLLELGHRNIHFLHGDGTRGWPPPAAVTGGAEVISSPAGPFDRLLIAACAPALPRALLLSQLTDPGVAVLPVGSDDAQMLVRVELKGGILTTTEICPCRFVRLLGSEGWAPVATAAPSSSI